MSIRSILNHYVVRHAVRGMLHPFYRTKYHGLDRVPRTGPIIFTPNHVSYFDPFWIGSAVPRTIHFMTWSAPFKQPALRPFLWFFQCFPVDQDAPVDKSALRQAQNVLERGEALMIFPEGGRSKSGRIDPFKVGAFRLAIKLDVPVLPVTIRGGYQVWPIGRKYPRTADIQVYFHDPVHFPREGRDAKRHAYEAAERVRSQIATCLEPHHHPVEPSFPDARPLIVRHDDGSPLPNAYQP